MTIEPLSLWRCKTCYGGVYQVDLVVGELVYYHYYDDHMPDRQFKKTVDRWLQDFVELSGDDVLVETGGIF